MESLFEFEVAYSDTRYRLTLSAETPSHHTKEASLVLSVTSGEGPLAAQADVQLRIGLLDRSLMVTGMLGLTSTEACLAACGVAGLVGPLVECYDRDARKYLDCMKTKGRSVAADVIKCAIGCAAGALVPPTP